MNSMQTINSILALPSMGIFFPQPIVTDSPNQKAKGQKPTEFYKDWKPYRTVVPSHRKKVFICSPFKGIGDTPEARAKDNERNLLLARQACRFAVVKGYTARAPHLYYPQFLDDESPDEREIGSLLGLLDLAECDELWIFGNRVSPGMVREIRYAEKKGIPIRMFKVLTTGQRNADVFGAEALFREVT